jgi:hypothetical protein
VSKNLPNQGKRDEATGNGARKTARAARDAMSTLETKSVQVAESVDPNARSNEKTKSRAGTVDTGAGALAELDQRIEDAGASKANIPACKTFKEFLLKFAKVLQRDGTGGKYSLEGRRPLELLIDWIDKVFRNTLDGETVEIDGVVFQPGQLKGASVAVGGGAQWGKTIVELNLMAYGTAVRFFSVGCYLPDRPKMEEIVSQKFRPNVLDLYPWMSEMIQLGKTENASGKTVDRKESYTVTDGDRKAFGNFCGMHKPPTSITIDVAILDEVDDIPTRNIGYVDGRMTGSPIKLTLFIGTQRIAGAGQNSRVKASSFHVKKVPCPNCKTEWNLEENFPRCIRLAKSGKPNTSDPTITAEMGHDRRGHYYVACPECGTELDRDSGHYAAKHPERIAEAKFGVRVSQLNISAITIDEIVGAWYSAMEDPTGEAIVAFWCDRIAIPNAGAAQPITQKVLDEVRVIGTGDEQAPEPYAMSLTRSETGAPRVAGMDMGPRCWFWCDEIISPNASACVWAELIASGNAPTRIPVLMHAMGIDVIFMDAGGEPDLTKRLALSLNGLDEYTPPQMPRNDLLKSHLSNLGVGLTWDGALGKWRGIRAAAVLFVAGESKGIEQTIGFTQDGKIFPLIKCNRSESIQTAVNDFLSPASGVLEMVGEGKKVLRQLPRARLPQTYIGTGVSQAVLDGHLLNLRKERDPKTGAEDWVDKVENHLGLAKVYARMATICGRAPAVPFHFQSISRDDFKPARTKGFA